VDPQLITQVHRATFTDKIVDAQIQPWINVLAKYRVPTVHGIDLVFRPGSGKIGCDRYGCCAGHRRAIALRLARDGFRILIADLNLAQARLVCDEIITAARGVAVRRTLQMRLLAQAVSSTARELRPYRCPRERCGDLCDLVRRSGNRGRRVDRVFGVNVRGMWLMMKAVFPAMRDQGSGSIIYVSSIRFSQAYRFAHYDASKGRRGLDALGPESSRNEHSRQLHHAGLTRTEVERTVDEPDRYDQLLRSQSIKRVSVPDDLVGRRVPRLKRLELHDGQA